MIELSVGMTVTRMLAGTVEQKRVITEIKENTFLCGDWEFSRKTGLEIDAGLGWTETKSGSFIREVKDAYDAERQKIEEEVEKLKSRVPEGYVIATISQYKEEHFDKKTGKSYTISLQLLNTKTGDCPRGVGNTIAEAFEGSLEMVGKDDGLSAMFRDLHLANQETKGSA